MVWCVVVCCGWLRLVAVGWCVVEVVEVVEVVVAVVAVVVVVVVGVVVAVVAVVVVVVVFRKVFEYLSSSCLVVV